MLATFAIATIFHYCGIYTFHSIDYLICMLCIWAVRFLLETNRQ